jgi:hypothetical protein
MTTSNGVTRRQAWGIAGWFLLGVLVLWVGALRYLLTEETVLLWWYADRYVAAELEVTGLRPIRSRRSTLGSWIDGVIHPGGEAVVADSRCIFPPADGTTRSGPAPDAREGQRLAVWYWPRHADVKRRWHPPTVVWPGATQRGGAVVRIVLSWVAFGLAVVFCFWRGFRKYRLLVPPDRAESPATPAWVGVALVLLYAGVLGSVAYLMSLPPAGP